jgi:RNA polymerase sigma factor (sigma-70 family)
MVRNTSEAEDLTQEAFLQLFRKINTFRGESAFSTWLHRVSVNVVLMRLRKKRLIEVPLEDSSEDEDPNSKEIGAPDPVLSGSIDRLNIDRAVEELPPGYRKAFMLHDVVGYEHREVAKILGCSRLGIPSHNCTRLAGSFAICCSRRPMTLCKRRVDYNPRNGGEVKTPTLANQRVGHPEKPNQSLSVDVLEWYHPTVSTRPKKLKRVRHPPP